MDLSKLAEYTAQATKDREQRIIAVTITELSNCIKQAMRENKISEDRADNIIVYGLELLGRKGE